LNGQEEREDIDPCTLGFSKEEKLDMTGSLTSFWNTQRQHMNIVVCHFSRAAQRKWRWWSKSSENQEFIPKRPAATHSRCAVVFFGRCRNVRFSRGEKKTSVWWLIFSKHGRQYTNPSNELFEKNKENVRRNITSLAGAENL
jgi:hypothetical protein